MKMRNALDVKNGRHEEKKERKKKTQTQVYNSC
jgi:hypothetical protein